MEQGLKKWNVIAILATSSRFSTHYNYIATTVVAKDCKQTKTATAI